MRVSELQRRASDLAHRGLGLEELCVALDRLLRRAVPYAAAAWATHDPATGLETSCTVTGIGKDPAREARLFRYEFREDEPASYLSMIDRNETVAILSQVTAGDLDRAGRYRHVLKQFGVTDELRVVLRANGRAWGSAALYRVDGPFSACDAEHAAAVAPVAARGLQLALLRMAATRPGSVDDAPGILQACADGRVVPLTEPGRRWLERGGAGLVTAVNAAAAVVRARREPSEAAMRLTLDDGPVLSLHAASMTAIDGAVAVIVDAARPVEVAAMLVDAYGLTRREREVLGLLLLGRSMAEIARELGISEHTAHDHRKAIYRRTGVSSRSELAALLQAEQYTPRSRAGAPPSPYGGFLTA